MGTEQVKLSDGAKDILRRLHDLEQAFTQGAVLELAGYQDKRQTPDRDYVLRPGTGVEGLTQPDEIRTHFAGLLTSVNRTLTTAHGHVSTLITSAETAFGYLAIAEDDATAQTRRF